MRKIIWIMFVLIVSVMFIGNTTQAATPRLMVSNYSVKEGSVVGGEEFNLRITMENKSNRILKNIKVTISTEQGEFIPVDGAGTAYLESIDANSMEDISFKMKAINGLEEKSYKLGIKTEYEGSYGMEYSVEENLFLPVSLKQRVLLSDILSSDMQVAIGDTVEISGSINNLGEGKLYNVRAELVGQNLAKASTYIGNIESGKAASMDLVTMATTVSDNVNWENNIKIIYEDKEGNVYEDEKHSLCDVTVVAPIYDNMEKVKDTSVTSKIYSQAKMMVITIVFVVLVVAYFYNRKKKKQAILDEF